ncbi:MAG: SDR family NAD(P)-dependent oxidoreductase [Myxococcota bacterium]
MTLPLRAVVTGAASGLGRALSLELAQRGGRVVISDIDAKGSEATAEQVRERGGEAHIIPCDVRDPAAVEDLAASAREAMGAVDLVANNAGVAVGGAFEQVSLDDWRWIVDINLWGVVNGCRAFYPAMKERGRGYIINVASLAGLVSGPQLAPYNMTKAGVVALSEALHIEARDHGVHVTALCPSFFVTNIAQNARGAINQRASAAIARAMQGSKVQAPEVAATAIDAVLAGQLYAVPMRDARVMWRLKRAAPGRFYSMAAGRIASYFMGLKRRG